MSARVSVEPLIILNMEAAGISEMLVLFIKLRGVIPQDCNLKSYLFREGQDIGRLDRMVKVIQVEPLKGSLEPCTCQRETGVVVYLWHPGLFKY
jgi:hypothetical protein